MSAIKQVRQRHADLTTAAREILDAAAGEARVLTEEEKLA